MKRILFAAAIAFGMCHAALAADTCAAQADSKKLAGAARNSFMKKCEADGKGASATTACESKAADKKLAGAAKNSFMKKCVADAKG
jgi:ribonuclease HII